MKACRIVQDWSYRGMRTVILENEFLKISILIDSGAKIFEFVHKPSDVDFVYHNPRVEYRTPVYGVNADNWWAGGIDEAIPTGHASFYRGEEYPYLGEIWSLPWSCRIERQSDEEVSLKLWRPCVIAPLMVEKWITLRTEEKMARFHHKVTNLGQSRFEFLWGIHPGLSINQKSRIDIPAEDVFVEESLPNDRLGKRGTLYKWPYAINNLGNKFDMRKVQPATAQTSDLHYAIKLRDGWLALTDTAKRIGFGLVFPKEIFRVIWMWLVYGGWRGLYCAAVEPWTGYPVRLDMAVKEGIYAVLDAGKSIECDTMAIAYEGVSKVEKITSNGEIFEDL